MKRLFWLLCLFAGFEGMAQQPFVIKGEMKNIKDTFTYIYMNYRVGSDYKMDSAQVKDGKYELKGSFEEAQLVRLRAAYIDIAPGKKRAISFKRDISSVFIGPGTVKVTSTDSFANISVKGSAIHDAYLDLQSKLKVVNDKQEALSKEYTALRMKKDEAGMKALEAKFDELDVEGKKIYKEYALANPKSPIALYAVGQFAGWDINADEVEPLFNALPAAVKAQPSAKELEEKIGIAKKTGIGKFAMDFTQNDTLGNPVTLSSFKGKYLLVDFWASWCGPCRAENPNVVKAFNQYKDKGFTILGVSLDQPNAKDKWIKAIHDDQLTWTHVSDLQYWKNAVAVQYGIQAIPQNLLIDKEGKIIGKNLRGEDLAQKLEELFK